MPGGIESGKSILSSEAQVLWRHLRKIKGSDDVLQALLSVLVALPQNTTGDAIRNTLQDLLPELLTQRSDLKNLVKQPPFNMALATEMAIHKAYQVDVYAKTTDLVVINKRDPTIDEAPRPRPGHKGRGNTPPPSTGMSVLESLGDNTAVVVTDNSSAGSELEDDHCDEEDEPFARSPAGRMKAAKECWNIILEAFNLQLAIRSTAKNRIYEVYQLSSPLSIASDLRQVQSVVENEFQIIQDSPCRAYAHLEQGELFLQLCIGEGRYCNMSSDDSRTKGRDEFVAVFNPGSALFALAAKKTPSRSPLTQFVLAALDAALTTASHGQLSHFGKALCAREQK